MNDVVARLFDDAEVAWRDVGVPVEMEHLILVRDIGGGTAVWVLNRVVHVITVVENFFE